MTDSKTSKSAWTWGGLAAFLVLISIVVLAVRHSDDVATTSADAYSLQSNPVTGSLVMTSEDGTVVGEFTAVADTTPFGPQIPAELKQAETPAYLKPIAPSVNPANWKESETAFFAGRYEDALAGFQAYSATHPGNCWGHYMQGLSLHRLGRYDDAETAYNAALAVKPDHSKSLVNLARTLLALDRPTEALAQAEEATAVDTKYAAAWRLVGRCNHELGKADKAVAAYEAAIRLDNTDAWSLNNLGLVLFEQGRNDDAIAPFALAARLSGDACFHNNLGMALEQTGRFGAASDAYRNAISVDATYAKAKANLARAEQVVEAADTAPLDLVALGQEFLDALQPQAVKVEVASETEVDAAEKSEASEIKIEPTSSTAADKMKLRTDAAMKLSAIRF